MSDIVERLRGADLPLSVLWSLRQEAADEIERLRARAVKLESHIVNEGLWDKFVEKFGDEEDIRALEGMKKTLAEIERLRALVRSAYAEGFSEGMNEHTKFNGGKPWEDSRACRELEGECDPSDPK